MNIVFTLPRQLIETIDNNFAGIKTDIETLRLPKTSKQIINSVKELIEQRFKLFEEEIEKEEKSAGDKAYILMDFSEDPLRIKYIGYSSGLKDKMNQSLTLNDLVYLEKFEVWKK